MPLMCSPDGLTILFTMFLNTYLIISPQVQLFSCFPSIVLMRFLISLLTYSLLFTRVPTHLVACLLTYLLTYWLALQLTCLRTHLPAELLTLYLSTQSLLYQFIFLATCISTYLLIGLLSPPSHTFVPTCQPATCLLIRSLNLMLICLRTLSYTQKHKVLY